MHPGKTKVKHHRDCFEKRKLLLLGGQENISIMMTVAVNINEKHPKQWGGREEEFCISDGWPKATRIP